MKSCNTLEDNFAENAQDINKICIYSIYLPDLHQDSAKLYPVIFSGVGIPIMKIRLWGDSLIRIMEFLILVKLHFQIGPWFLSKWDSIFYFFGFETVHVYFHIHLFIHSFVLVLIKFTRISYPHFNGLLQDCSFSIVNALEILQCCCNPSIYCPLWFLTVP